LDSLRLITENMVLERAIELAILGGVQSEHGDYCPFCLIGEAKSRLDEETGEGLTFFEALSDWRGNIEYPSDKPLAVVRDRLKALIGTSIPDRATSVIDLLEAALD